MPSSIRQPRENPVRPRAVPEDVVIDDWPLRDRPLESLAAIVAALSLSGAAWWLSATPAGGLVIGVILALTLWRVWLPVRYEIGAGGVNQSVLGWRRPIAWSAIGSYQVRTRGVVLLPDAAATPLRLLRGLYLPWGRHRREVLALVEDRLAGLEQREP